MNNYDEIIMNIKENQKKLLVMVKDKIQEENAIFNLNSSNIIDVLNHNNKVAKKYEALVNARKLISEYTEAIHKATSIDEIKEIRKNLNKCINLIKREMKNRGIDDIEYNDYCEKVKNYRKNISMNIRFLKREEKINEIDSLYHNFDNLNEEELLRLKKLIKNEASYGKKHLGEDNVNKEKMVIRSTKKNEITLKEPLFPISKEAPTKKVIEIDERFKLTLDIPPAKKSVDEFEHYDSIEDFVKARVVSYNGLFKIRKTEEYNGNFIKNIVVFGKNLPKLVNNKKSAKSMIAYYNSIGRRAELLAYSRYITNNSSIMSNLKGIVKRSSLEEKENSLKEEYDETVDWIIEYCKSHHKRINYAKV